MRYYKATMNNGYCGCEEVELFTEPDSVNVGNQYALDLLQNYSFYEPDSRFIDEDYFGTQYNAQSVVVGLEKMVTPWLGLEPEL